VRILRGFLKGVHWSRITGSQIHPVRNATKSRACCGNDAPRAEKRDTDSKVLALSSELGNPHRTRVPTFPQQRLRRRTNLPKLQNPPKSQGLTDSCAEPELFRQLGFFTLSCKPISYCRFKRIDVYIL
jgi:hypothetical protein